jgi:hypothetical protein
MAASAAGNPGIRLGLIGPPDPTVRELCCFPGSRCDEYPSLRSALAEISEPGVRNDPDLVIVVQQWSDEYRADEVEELLAALPLARICCAYGPLCRSDGRTRSQWPIALRVPQEELPARLKQEVAVLKGELQPLPRTAGYEEIFAFMANTSHLAGA